MTASWSIQTPTGAPGAIGIIQLIAPAGQELDDACKALALPRLSPGALRVADLLGVDRGVLARWDERTLHLMPHAGPHVLRSLSEALTRAGLPHHHRPDVRAVYPEGGSVLECRMLDALARARSPLAIDLLLDQPRRWRAHERGALPPPDDEHSRVLSRLIDPPLIVAVGPPNIGKSTLLNTLAGRSVALVADEPGTTRDHLGASIDLAGLVVRYADTPGVRPNAPALERDAIDLALALARRADLLLLCGDAGSPPIDPRAHALAAPALRLALRDDLGTPDWAHDLAISARSGHAIDPLITLLRDTLLPPRVRLDPRPWRFWNEPTPTPSA